MADFVNFNKKYIYIYIEFQMSERQVTLQRQTFSTQRFSGRKLAKKQALNIYFLQEYWYQAFLHRQRWRLGYACAAFTEVAARNKNKKS